MTARSDAEITRHTCGAWAWLYEECPGCGHDEVLTPYLTGRA